jgi:type I restriction enzyme S subunit
MPKSEHGTEIKSNKFVVPPGAVLVSKLNPRIPRIWLPGESKRRSICSTEFIIALPKVASASRDFLAAMFRSPAFLDDSRRE